MLLPTPIDGPTLEAKFRSLADEFKWARENKKRAKHLRRDLYSGVSRAMQLVCAAPEKYRPGLSRPLVNRLLINP